MESWADNNIWSIIIWLYYWQNLPKKKFIFYVRSWCQSSPFFGVWVLESKVKILCFSFSFYLTELIGCKLLGLFFTLSITYIGPILTSDS